MSRKALISNNIYNSLPRYLIITGIYNVLFQYIGLNYVYIFLYLISIFWALSKKFSKPRNLDILVVTYLILILISSLISIVIKQQKAEIIFVSSFMYLLPILFWFLYYKTNKSYDYYDLILSLKWHVFIIAVFGLVQYYFSPDLFGVINSESNNIKWAIDNEEYRTFFRSTSILGSPQVFGSFIALYVVAFLTSIKSKKARLSIKDILLVFIFIIAGAHSSNKSFFAVMLIYLLYQLYKNKLVIQTVITFSLIIFVVYYFKDNFLYLNRIFFNENLFQEEIVRIDIWRNALINAKIIGDGPGSWSNSSFNFGNMVVESFFLQVIIELGFLAFFLFVVIIICNWLKIRRTDFAILFIVCVFIMLIVHVYSSPAFILYWGVCLYGLHDNTLQQNIRQLNQMNSTH